MPSSEFSVSICAAPVLSVSGCVMGCTLPDRSVCCEGTARDALTANGGRPSCCAGPRALQRRGEKCAQALLDQAGGQVCEANVLITGQPLGECRQRSVEADKQVEKPV